MSPPKLARDAPVADVAHPLEIFGAAIVRHDFDVAALHGRNRGLGQRLHFHKPLRRSARLDDRSAAVARSDGVRVVDNFFEQPRRFEIGDDALPRLKSVEAGIFSRRGAHFRVVGHDVDFGQVVAASDFKVVRIVRRSDFHRAGPKFAVHDKIVDDGNFAVHQRQQNHLADQMLVARVARMNGHGRVPQHGFGPRGGHDDVFVRPHDRVADVPEVALPLFVNGFEVADRGAALRAPVHDVMAAINQAIFVKAHEDFSHRARKFGRKREALARPVAAFAELNHLPRDRPAGFGLPFPDFFFKRFAAQVAVIDALRGKLAHHDALRRDPRVVGPRQVQRVVALHPPPARQDIDLGVVEHVADVQRSGHIRRRDNDGKHRARRIHVGAKQVFFRPFLRPPLLDQLRLVSLGNLSRHVLQPCG